MEMYDREGNPLLNTLAALSLFNDVSYQVLEQTYIYDVLVSTVWLCFNHRFSAGAPLIFETMVFDTKGTPSGRGRDDVYQMRYSTENEAFEGHRRACLMAWNHEFDRPLKQLTMGGNDE